MEPIGQLAKALAIAQGKMVAAKKGRENPFFKSRYSTLQDIWDVAREPLSANGLAVVQLLGADQSGVTITTILVHASGERIEGLFSVPVAKRDAQGFGSAATYARRYALAAILGVVTDDDDDGNDATGNGSHGRASSRPVVQRTSEVRRAEPEPVQQDEPPDDIPMKEPGGFDRAATMADLKRFCASGGGLGQVKKEAEALGYHGRSLENLSDDELDSLYCKVFPDPIGSAT